jgi:serine/threonine protein kinase
MKRLGAGQYSDVWAARWNNQTLVAVKALHHGLPISIEEFLRQAAVLRTLRHPNLLQSYAVCVDESTFLVTQLVCCLCFVNNILKHALTPLLQDEAR